MTARRSRRLALIAAAVLAACEAGPKAAPPSPPPNVTDRLVQLEIRGARGEDLDREITLGGHLGEDGKRYGGDLQCNLRYRFRSEPSGAGCRVAEVITEAEVVLTLPRWTDPDGADEALRRRWERFLAALRAHEEGHRRLCVEAIGEVRRELLVLTRPTCGELQAAAARTYAGIEARFSRMSDDYDVATRHGETQGASPRVLYP